MTMPQPTPAVGRVPVLEAVREGFAFVGRDWRAILPVALVIGAAVGGLQVFVDLARARQDVGATLLGTFGTVVAQVALVSALLRRALSESQAPVALRAGRDELNLLGVVFSLGFLYFIIAIFALIVISMCLGVLASGAQIDPAVLQSLPPEEAARKFFEALGPDGLLVLLVLGFAFLLLFLWIAARVILAQPATIAEGRMFVFSTWAWTKGNSGTLMGCLFLLVVGGVLLGILALAPFGLALDIAFGKGAQLNPASPAHWIMSVLGGFANSMLSTAPFAGMAAFLYRGLRPETLSPAN